MGLNIFSRKLNKTVDTIESYWYYSLEVKVRPLDYNRIAPQPMGFNGSASKKGVHSMGELTKIGGSSGYDSEGSPCHISAAIRKLYWCIREPSGDGSLVSLNVDQCKALLEHLEESTREKAINRIEFIAHSGSPTDGNGS